MDIRKSFNQQCFNIKVGVLALGLLSPLASQAFLIDSTTTFDTFTVDYSLANAATDPNGNTNDTGYDLTASVLISMTDFNAASNFISLELTVTNTTDITNDKEIGLQKLAFGTTPDATGVVFTDASDGEFIEAHLFTNSDSQLHLGNTLSLDTVSETGVGANNRLLAGESDTFFLTISFTDLLDEGVTFSPFSSKWQTDPASFQFAGEEPGPGPGPGPSIPEPSPLALLGLGALLLRWSSRKSKA